MANTAITFSREMKGYNREQVDSYVKKVGDAYQTSYDEYQALRSRLDDLLEENKALKAQPKAEPASMGLNSDVIAKALVNAEMLAQQSLADARAEAAVILADARTARDEATAEALRMKEAAQRMVEGAKAEAAVLLYQARTSIEAAHKAMGRATDEMGAFLAQNMPERNGGMVER